MYSILFRVCDSTVNTTFIKFISFGEFGTSISYKTFSKTGPVITNEISDWNSELKFIRGIE